MTLRIEKATQQHVSLILSFIRKLAEYERKAHEVVATETGLRDALFGPRPIIEVLIAYLGEEPVGFALYFFTFSTFRGQRGVFLEDLFVEPAHRSKGIGTALLKALANVASELGCSRIEWWVLKWNQPAINFYKRFGAVEVDEWGIFRLAGEAFSDLGNV